MGAAAFRLVGDSDNQTITGTNITPGKPARQSAHRSELGGICGIITALEVLCHTHNITAGSIEIGLDALAAKNHISYERSPQPSTANYDMIMDIRRRTTALPVAVVWRWVEGHQDDRGRKLDWWAKLNIAMNKKAKSALKKYSKRHKQPPPNIRFENPGWQLEADHEPQETVDVKELYEHTYGKKTKTYWSKKDQLSETATAAIDWKTCGKAFTALPLGKQRWLAKHITHFCAVGTTMLQRKKQDHSTCPRCLDPIETTTHVLTCPAPSATSQWKKCLDKVNDWLEDNKTEPQLQETIIARLSQWRKGHKHTRIPPADNSKLRRAVKEQDTIGWEQFLYGRVSKKLIRYQGNYLGETYNSKKTGTKWTQSLLKQIHEIPWDM
jgi:hypothetical protein